MKNKFLCFSFVIRPSCGTYFHLSSTYSQDKACRDTRRPCGACRAMDVRAEFVTLVEEDIPQLSSHVVCLKSKKVTVEM